MSMLSLAMKICFVALFVVVTTAAAIATGPTTAPVECSRAAESLFNSALAGDAKALRDSYTRAAWAQIESVGPDEKGRTYADRCKLALSGATLEIEPGAAEGNRALVVLKLTTNRSVEHFRASLTLTNQSWLIDSDALSTLPLCLDHLTPTVLVWEEAFDKPRTIKGLAAYYEQVLIGLQRAELDAFLRPDDVGARYTLANIYFEQLGRSVLSDYTAQRLREETQSAAKSPAHRPLLDSKGFLLRDADEELEYLRPFNTKDAGGFPLGIGPDALAYNHFKQASVLERAGGRFEMVSDQIIDSRPAMALKFWAEAECKNGRRLELGAYGVQSGTLPTEELEKQTAVVRTSPSTPEKLSKAILCYRRGVMLTDMAKDEYEAHLKAFPKNREVYASHLTELHALGETLAADADYLQSFLPGEDAKRLSALSTAGYRSAKADWQRHVLKFYVSAEAIAAVDPNTSKGLMNDLASRAKRLDAADADQISDLMTKVNKYYASRPDEDYNRFDREDYDSYVQRIDARLNPPTTRPITPFLPVK